MQVTSCVKHIVTQCNRHKFFFKMNSLGFVTELGAFLRKVFFNVSCFTVIRIPSTILNLALRFVLYSLISV